MSTTHVAFLLAAAVSLLASAETSTAAVYGVNPCPLPRPERHPLYRYTDPERRPGLEDGRIKLCKWIDDSPEDARSVRQAQAARAMDARIVRRAACRAATPNPLFMQLWTDSPASQAMGQLHAKFCIDTAGRARDPYLIDRVKWLRTETFCQMIRYSVDPGGWRSLFKPDVPSYRRLDELSRSLCEDLRKGALSLGDAQYRWQQELLWTYKHLPAEVGKDVAPKLLDLLNQAVKAMI